MCDSKIMTVKVQRSIWGSPAVLIYNKDKSFCKEYPFDKIFKRIMGNLVKGYFKVKIETLTDSIYALARMEMNCLYFRGYKDCVSLAKIFDGSFIESEEFEAFFI